MVLKDVARHPKIIGPTALSDKCSIYLKPENLQHTGSFKLRGAYYKISQLTDEEKKRGVIARGRKQLYTTRVENTGTLSSSMTVEHLL